MGSGSDAGVGAVSGTAGTAIAYPYPGYPGSPGVAPDHTIVVTGVGQADLGADGSGRAAAVKKALAAALADAKGQADLTAQTVGVTIIGVLSVSTSVQDYGPIFPPVPMEGTTKPNAPVATPSDRVSLPQLSVAVTVAYSIS
ncbi:MAG TPA: SIMPL domain-containing protein [Candidatus Dormibacteraeota bacterium]|nr:SIMPL domain-containing protein [Candidatus Dormibacteraeota bacterium]